MAEIPPNTITDVSAELAQWKHAKEQAAAWQAKERLMRARLFGHFFPAPTEGTNTVELPDGRKVKGKYPIDRKVDEGALDAFKGATVGSARAYLQTLGFNVADKPDDMLVCDAIGLPLGKLIKYSPELSVKPYRTLTEEQRKVFDTVLTVKPGSFAIEVVEAAATEEASQ